VGSGCIYLVDVGYAHGETQRAQLGDLEEPRFTLLFSSQNVILNYWGDQIVSTIVSETWHGKKKAGTRYSPRSAKNHQVRAPLLQI
jgi:hypothetical protein